MRGVLFRVSELNTAQNARHTVESPPPIGENARCFIPCVKIKHRAGCPRHSCATAPIGERKYKYDFMEILLLKLIEISVQCNKIAINRTPRQVPLCQNKTPRRMPDTLLGHRPYRGEEIQTCFHGNIIFKTDQNIS